MDNNTSNKKSFFITALILALVIIAAAIIYKNLSGKDQSRLVPMTTEKENTVTAPDENPQPPTSEESELPVEAPDKTTEHDVQLAPDFTVEDIFGNYCKLSDFRGKPVIINFWASWCGPCKKEMPDFEELYKEYGEQINFLMVNMTDGRKETKEKAMKHITSEGYTFPVYFDTMSQAAYAYGVTSIPATYFIDSAGYPVIYGIGALNKATLLKGIGMFPEFTE